MPARVFHRVATLAWLLLLTACMAMPDDGVTQRPMSEFEQRLDRLGVDLTLPPGKAILVNVPAYELVAFDNGVPVMRSRIIVGSPVNPTPILDTAVSRVTFRPTWRPTPDMIKTGEYEDKLWPPGADNPLGLAAVRLDPGMLIYLHDTNRRDLFNRKGRAMSHGCIRVERWDGLIAWILDRDLDWVNTMAAAPPSREIPAPAIPVLIRYLRVFPAADGTVYKHHDIYGLEGEQQQVQVPQGLDMGMN